MSDAERQAKTREKAKAIKEGTYSVGILDRAKAEVAVMLEPDIKQILDNPEYSGQLTVDQIAQLNTYVKNRKQKQKLEKRQAD